MEIARIWRTTHQRIRLEGEVCLRCDEKIFPPRPKHECKEMIIFDSNLFLSPNDQVVHGEVVRHDQEQNNESKNQCVILNTY